MEVRDLRNYGRGWVGIMTDQAEIKRMEKIMSREFRKEVGFWTALRLMLPIRSERKRMKKHDWSDLTERGVPQEFIDSIVEILAITKVLADKMGMEKATEIHCRLWDREAYEIMKYAFPDAWELRMCGDPFGSFKEWIKAFETADINGGISEIRIKEDSPNALAYDETFCAINEIARELGDPYLAYPSLCYFEEAFMPQLAGENGWRYRRKGTLSTGAAVCDNRFERPAG